MTILDTKLDVVLVMSVMGIRRPTVLVLERNENAVDGGGEGGIIEGEADDRKEGPSNEEPSLGFA